MHNYLSKLEPRFLKMVRDIGRLANTAGYKSYVAGGCVRDLILGRLVKDLDVVIEGDALQVAQRFAAKSRGDLIVYKQFGTATVSLKDGRVVDFTTLRSEQYPYPGALPVVSSGTLQQDLFRRDFTINAMVISIDPSSFGVLTDQYDGLSDLKRGLIRVLHNQSFVDDPTRIFRAVRFEQRFGFEIESVTLKLLRQALRSNVFKTVKPPRLYEEFRKNLKEDSAVLNLKRLYALGGLSVFSVGNSLGRETWRMLNDVGLSIRWAKNNIKDVSLDGLWLMFWMVLCHQTSAKKCRLMMEQFAFRTYDRDKVLNVLTSQDVLKELARKTMTSADVFMVLRNKSIEEVLYLMSKSTVDVVRARIKRYLVKSRHAALKINGDDLKQLGVPSGIVYKKILDEVLKRVVDGQLRFKSQQLSYAGELYKHNKL